MRLNVADLLAFKLSCIAIVANLFIDIQLFSYSCRESWLSKTFFRSSGRC